MEVKIPLEKLKTALDVARFTTTSAAPVLAAVHVACSGGTLECTAYDGETGARVAVTATSADDGAGLLPRPAVEYINALPAAGEVHLTFDTGSVKIACGTLGATMRTEDPANYPKISFADNDGVDLPAAALRNGIRQVRAAAAAAGSSRPALAGVLFEVTNGELRLVTTDSYRLAVTTLGSTTIDDGARITVPIRAVNELERFLAKAGSVTVRLADISVCFEVEHIKLMTRLIAEKFPNYGAIVPAPNAPMGITAGADGILESIKRLKIVAPRENRSVRVSCKDGAVSISTTAATGDAAVEPVDATTAGDVPDFAVNVDYLADAITALGSETVHIAIHDPLKPLLLTRPGDDSTKQIMMPIRV